MPMMSVVMMILVVLLCFETKPVRGFASNLIVSSMGCMTELDTSEVIMNNYVKSAEDSDFPNMHLAVLVGENRMEESSPFQYRPAPGTTAAELTIQFVNPYTSDEFREQKEMQFVIQLQDTTTGEGGTTTSAEFVSGGTIGCEGNQRVSARWGDNEGKVQLQIHDISASFKLWAGWATGQSAVRLTPALLLEPAAAMEDADVDTEDPPVGEAVKDPEKKVVEEASRVLANEGKHVLSKQGGPKEEKGRAEEVRQEERKMGHMKEKHKINQEKQDLPGEKKEPIRARDKKEFVEAAKKMKDVRKNRREVAARGDAKSRADEDPGTPVEEEEEEFVPPSKEKMKLHPSRHKQKAPSEARKPYEDRPPAMDEAKRRQDLAEQMERNFPDQRSFRRRYDQGVELSTTSHMAGSAFFLLTMGAIIFAFGKRRGEKGRRDL